MRILAIVLSTLVVQTGCGISHEYRTHATLGGGALAIAGILVARPKPVDSDMNGHNDFFLNDDYSGFIPGTLMFIGGLALLIAGLSAREPTAETPAHVAPKPLEPIATMQPTVPVQPPLAPLPETAVTVQVLQLAKQVRSAAAYGLCDAARATLARVTELDASYAEELRMGPVLAPCQGR